MTFARCRFVALVGAAATAVAACGSDAPKPPPLVFTAVASCPASVVAPADVVTTTPSSSKPPTTILKVGDAVAFSSVRGALIQGAGQPAAVCQSPRPDVAPAQTAIVATRPGFVRIAIVASGAKAQSQLLITVSG